MKKSLIYRVGSIDPSGDEFKSQQTPASQFEAQLAKGINFD